MTVRLALTPLEDRSVPSVVTVAAVANAAEGGAAGAFRFTRTGDTTAALTMTYTVTGTATAGTDYATLSGSVTFAAGAATADVAVGALADTVYDPDETVTVSLPSPGPGSEEGGSGSASLATITIADDINTVQTLIHQQTFQLTGANGPVDVSLTVTYNAPGAIGQYTWVYTVTNPSGGSSLTNFTVPIDGSLSDVGGLSSTIGWAGAVGSSGVSWTGTGLAAGASATFKFVTDPRDRDRHHQRRRQRRGRPTADGPGSAGEGSATARSGPVHRPTERLAQLQDEPRS